MIRGHNNRFYFVEKDKTGTFDTVNVLELQIPEGQECWKWTKYPVFMLGSGHIIALEIDPFAQNDEEGDLFDQ